MSFYPEKRIPIDELKDRSVYKGECRNASHAIWLADKKQFVYIRAKFFSIYTEEIYHFDDPRTGRYNDGFCPEQESTMDKAFKGKSLELIEEYLSSGYESQNWSEPFDG